VNNPYKNDPPPIMKLSSIPIYRIALQNRIEQKYRFLMKLTHNVTNLTKWTGST